ncbi:MAG: META domain-containing protein [Rhodobacteraceae bacterium]|nr:META domain-containing protein [Paracoccaceae bacterium]
MAILGIGGVGIVGWAFSSGKFGGDIGGTSMTLSSVETFDGAWIVQKATDIDLTGFDNMRFDFVAGTLYGSGPCRSFETAFGPDTQNLMFSPFEIGGGMCDEQIMITERDFFEQIKMVNRLEIDSDERLVMYNFDQPLVWLRRLTK